MPGELLSLTSSQARAAREAVAGLEGVRAALLVGDSVHIVVDDAKLRTGELERALAAAGIADRRLEPLAPSIEDLFSALLGQGGAS